MRSFASDNNSGVHRAVLDAIVQANSDHAVAYGNDGWTERALSKFHEVFGADIDGYLVFGGTAANVLSISCMLRSYQSVICSSFSHLYVDECGSPETFTGCKLVPVEAENAKLTIEAIRPHLARVGDVHGTQPRVLSITQANEYGLVYSPDEVRDLCKFARDNGLFVHMDGARLANAAAALGLGLREASGDLGIDVLSFGGTKNGLMYGDAVVFFNREFSESVRFFRKQLGQLASKMRFISTQFNVYLTDDLWLQNARHANEMAQELAHSIENLPGIEISRPVQTNMVFAELDTSLLKTPQEKYTFSLLDSETIEIRFVTSFDTTQEDIERFVEPVTSGSV